jgi:signal transduction histidine kinase
VARDVGGSSEVPNPETSLFAAIPSPRRIAEWREAYLHGLLLTAVFLPFDFLYPRRLGFTLAIRLGLLAVLAACRWGLSAVPPRRAGLVVALGALAAALLTPLLVVASSGGDGPRFGFLLTVPFVLLSLLPAIREVVALSVAAGIYAAIVGGVALLLEGRSPGLVAEWTIVASVVSAVTALGARRVGGLARRAAEAERDRLEAVARLEESERRRTASERLALLGRLAAGIGHEINNPLSAVKGNVACALAETAPGGAQASAQEALTEALDACERISWITSDLRAFGGDPTVSLVPCAVDAAIRDALRSARARLGSATVITAVEPGLPPVRSEPRLLADAIGQLAVARRGAAPADRTTLRISARRAADGIEIAIEVDGPPIPADVLPRVFEPAAAPRELHRAGLPLTLPLTRELAERCGGRVEAARRDGGSRFTVTLRPAED